MGGRVPLSERVYIAALTFCLLGVAAADLGMCQSDVRRVLSAGKRLDLKKISADIDSVLADAMSGITSQWDRIRLHVEDAFHVSCRKFLTGGVRFHRQFW